ncbi:hypothetical protein STFR1_60136 [Bacillus vallismortis]
MITLNMSAYNSHSTLAGQAVCKTYFSFLLVYVILILGIYLFKGIYDKRNLFYFPKKM